MLATVDPMMSAVTRQAQEGNCGAKTRAGTPCQQVAGWGTDHVGNGRCKLHGGKSTGPPIRHGRYSIKHHNALAEKVEAFRAAPVDNLAEELALVRALLQDMLDKLGASPNKDEREGILLLVSEIRQTVSAITKIRNSTALTGQEIQLLIAHLKSVLEKYVPGDKLPAALDELRAALQPRRRT